MIAADVVAISNSPGSSSQPVLGRNAPKYRSTTLQYEKSTPSRLQQTGESYLRFDFLHREAALDVSPFGGGRRISLKVD
jgi:hypothetical protein